MAQYHSLEERNLPIACDDTLLKRISGTKLLGVCVDQHLTWKTHVDSALSSSYGTLSVLRRLKHPAAPFHVRKHLAESLVISKVNYTCSVFHPLSAVSNAVYELDLSQEGLQVWMTLNWLPVNKTVELNILK